MIKMTNAILKFILMNLFCLLITQVEANEVRVITDEQEFCFDVAETESLREIAMRVRELSNNRPENYLIVFSDNEELAMYSDYDQSMQTRGGSLGHPRDYYCLVTAEEKSDLYFIVTTLANKSLVALAMARSELEGAGDRIEHIHPLRFLHTIFTDEELKVAIKNTRSRGWVWNNFMSGLKSSFYTEYEIGNIREEHILDFCSQVKIDPRIIEPAVQRQEWDQFVDLLIRHVPREGGSGRYD